MEMQPIYMSVTEAVKRYCICRAYLYRLFALEGCPKILKMGTKVLIPIKEFDEFFAAAATQQTTQERSRNAGRNMRKIS